MRESLPGAGRTAIATSLRLTLPRTLGLVVAGLLLATPVSAQYVLQVLHALESPPASPAGPLIEGSDGALYGTTHGGGASDYGTIFRVAKDGTGLVAIHEFDGTDGSFPDAGLIEDPDGFLYGTTERGGVNNDGAVFKIRKDGTGFVNLHDCSRAAGAWPMAGLLAASDSALYGTTAIGGANGHGTIFRIVKDGTGFSTLASFDGTNGDYPVAALSEGSDGELYGTTLLGGGIGVGTVFRIGKDGSAFQTLLSFDGMNATGYVPRSSVIEGADGALYGTTSDGGTSGKGTLFRIAKDGTGFTTLLSFAGTNGANPFGGLIEGSDGSLYGTTYYGGTNDKGTVFKISKAGVGLATLLSFDGTDGDYPRAALVEAADGALYGTTATGGTTDTGTIFTIGKDGAGFTKLLEFERSSGRAPTGVIEGSDHSLYGTNNRGGSSDYGTIFKLGKDGSGFTTLLEFDGAGGNGYLTSAPVVEASDGDLYGTTYAGGTTDMGTVFKVGKDGTGFTTLHSFDGPHGDYPADAVIEGSDGVLYGTTEMGGANDYGTVFMVGKDGSGFSSLWAFTHSEDGAYPLAALMEGSDTALYGTTFNCPGTIFKWDSHGFSILHSLTLINGRCPGAPLIEGSDGALYGTTEYGGTNDDGVVFRMAKDGSGYRKLVEFNGANGAHPSGALVEGSDGNLYGTTYSGGTSDKGTVFKIGRGGTAFATLLSFDGANGAYPLSALTKGSDGAFYGTTSRGGPGGGGVVFRLAHPPTADLSTISLSFGSQRVDTSSPTQNVRISNNGGSQLHLAAPGITGANVGDFTISSDTCSGPPVESGGSCTIGLYFQPTAVGARTAALRIDDDATNSPQTVRLSGTGTAPAASLSSSRLVFPNQLVGTTSAPHLVTLHNTGTAPLAITSITTSGEFSETTTCGASLGKGASCTIIVTFTPTDVGLRKGDLTIVDDASGSPRDVGLSGTGIEPRFEFTRSVFSATEAALTAIVTVTRTVAAATATTVDYATSDGTATAGADYVAAAGHLSFAPGVIARTIAIKLLADTTYEGTESFLMALSSPQGPGAKLGSQTTAVVAITDNDPVPSIQFAASAYTATEGGPAATIAVVRSGVATVPVTVDYAALDGTATAPGDYATATGTLSFGPGALSRTFSVAIADDQVPEPSEYLDLMLSNPGGGAILGPRPKAKLTIKDNDQAVQLSASTYPVAEGGKAIITVKRTGGTSGTLIVDYATVDGTATAPADYGATAGHLTFGPGVALRTFVVPTVNDATDEGSETVNLTLANPNPPGALGSPATATLIILDNEPVVQFSAPKYVAAEPAASGMAAAIVTVKRLGGLTATAHVGYVTSAGTAVPGIDYTETSGQLTFGPGVAARTFSVPLLGNTVDEPNPTVNLTLSPVDIPLGTPSAAVLAITDDDVAGKAQLAATAFSGLASTGGVTITVTRSGGTAGPASVQYSTSDGTAVAGTAYTAMAGTVTFGPGETSHSFTVPVASIGLPNRYFVVTLGATTGNLGLGPKMQAPCWIIE